MGATDSFSEREIAMQKLLLLPRLPIAALTEASKKADPEIRWRAKLVLEKGGPESRRVLFAVFKTIELKPVKGTVSQMLRAVPLCDEQIFKAAQQALKATATAGDAETLRKGLATKNDEVRIAAALAIGKALGKDAAEDLVPLLGEPDDRLKLAAAEALADVGNRKSLASLLKLLSSSEVAVRSRSAAILKQLTGQRFRFAAYDSREGRSKAVAKWVAWTKDNGRTSALHFPLKSLHVELGRTLVCSGSKVIEFDANGKKTWEVAAPSAWGCYGLPDGRRFIASYSQKTLSEYDAKGNLTRKYQLPGNPYDVQVLDNGNFLIPSYDTSQAYEMRPDGTVVWKNTAGKPVGATRLENGNTLVCLHDKGTVIEVDPTGKTIWTVGGLSQPYTAQRLENGNTLICITGKQTVAEYDPSGKVVWSRTGLAGYDVQRLPNGNTIVCQNGVKELDPNGKVVWQTPNMSVTRFCRY